MMQRTVTHKMKGEYRLVVNSGMDSEKDTGWFDNLITDGGLDQYGTTSLGNATLYASVGTGTTAPAVTDTALVNRIGPSSSPINGTDGATSSGSPNYSMVITKDYAFALGAVVGNIAEIGVGPASNGTSLFSRARIIDGAGVPTTLTVTSMDQLTVYYRLTVTNDMSDVSDSVTISGTPYSYTMRASDAASNSVRVTSFHAASYMQYNCVAYGTSGAALGSVTSSPSGSSQVFGVDSIAYSTYTPGSFTRDAVFTWGTSAGNAVGGIKAIKFQGGGGFDVGWPSVQVLFGTAIPKDNTKQLVLTLRHVWARV